MRINGKEYGMYYSIGAHVAFDNWAIQNPKASWTEGVLMKFTFMVMAHNSLHKIKQEPPTKEELSMLPNSTFEEIAAAVDACEKADSERKVEAEPKKGKNGRSTASGSTKAGSSTTDIK